MGNPLPKKLEKSPLIAATVEFRLKNAVPNSVLLGKLFPALGSSYDDLQVLGPGSIPEEVLKQNPNLLFLPHYRAKGANSLPFQVLFGPRVVAFSTRAPTYDIDFGSEGPLCNLLQTLEHHGLLADLERVGLRYINIFEGLTSLDHMALATHIGEDDVANCVATMRLEIPKDPFKLAVTVARDATANISDDNIGPLSTLRPENERKGSILDIDTSLIFDSSADPITAVDAHEYLKTAHHYAEEVFFKVLTPEFVESLGPSY